MLNQSNHEGESSVLSSEKGYCSVYTKFTENYRLSQSIQMGSQIQSVHKQDGTDEFFCLRTDGYVESFFTDINSSTGYKNETTPLHGTVISSICCQNGDVVIFAYEGAKLYYVKKVMGSSSYSEAKRINMKYPKDKGLITGISVKQIGNNVWILVLFQSEGLTYAMYGIWEDDDTRIADAFYTVYTVPSATACTWLSSNVDDPMFVIAGRSITGMHVVSRKTETFPQIPVTMTSYLSIDSVYDDINQCDVLAAICNNDVYVLLNTAGCEWVKTDQDIKANQAYLYNEINMGIHIFCHSVENEIVHGYITTEEEDLFKVISPLISNCTDFCVTYRGNSTPSLFCNNSDTGIVNYFLLEEESHNWNVQEITLSSENNVSKYVSYMSEITAYDSCGLIYPNASIKVGSNEDTRIEVNGNVVMVGPNTPIDLKTNANGVISISQETQTLSVPDLFVSFIPDSTKLSGPPTEDVATLSIYQYAPMDKILKNITGTELINATKNDGQPLLSDEYRNAEKADALAESLRQCVGLIDSNVVKDAAPRSTGHGYSWISSSDAINRSNRIVITDTLKTNAGWSLRKNGSSLIYSIKSQEEINMLLERVNFEAKKKRGLFKRIGDFVKAIAEKVVEVVEVVVTVVENVVTTVIEYIQGTARKFFYQAVDCAQQVFDAVESIFDEVKVSFNDVFEWIGYIFNWNDILRTKTMLDYCTDEIFLAANNTIDYVADKVESTLEQFENEIVESIDNFVKKIDPNASVGAVLDGSVNPDQSGNEEVKYQASNNFLYIQYIERDVPYLSSQNSLAIDNFSEFSDELNEFMQILQEFTESIENTDAFSQAYNYFSEMLTSRDNMFNMMLCGLLKIFEGLAVVVVSAASAIVRALLLLIKQLLNALHDLLTSEIKLPFLSSLFSLITNGDKLTVSGVSSLILALPTTLIYKMIKHKAPISNDAEFEEFKQYVNADRLTNAITGQTSMQSSLNGNYNSVIAPMQIQSVLNTVNALSSCVYYMASSYVDGASCISDEVIPFKVNLVTLTCEAIWALASAPCWFTDPSWAEWAYFSIVCTGLCMDTIFLIKDRAMPENSDAEWPKGLTFVYGVGFEASGIVALCIPSSTPTVASGILTVVPPLICCTKLGLLKCLIDSTYGISAGIPVIGGDCAGLTLFFTYLACAYKCKGENDNENNNTLPDGIII